MIGDFVDGGDVQGEVLVSPTGQLFVRISDARGFSIHELPEGSDEMPAVEELRRMRAEVGTNG